MNISCLNTSAAVQSWLAEHGHSNHDALGMQAAVARYLGATSETLRKHGKAPIVWQVRQTTFPFQKCPLS